MNKEYNIHDVNYITSQLRRVKDPDGDPVFTDVEITESGIYYTINLKNFIGIAIIELSKQKPEQILYDSYS